MAAIPQKEDKQAGWSLGKKPVLSFGMLFITVSIFVNLIFVWQWVNTIVIAALVVLLPVTLLVWSLVAAIGTGGNFVLSRHLHEGEKPALVIGNMLILMFFLSFAFVLPCLYFYSQLLLAFGADDTVVNAAQQYVFPILLSIPFLAILLIGNTIIQSEKKAGFASILLIIPVCVNLALSFIFIKTFKTAILGSAVASAVSFFVGFLLVLWFLVYKSPSKLRLKHIQFKYSIVKQILKLGFPVFARQIMRPVVGLVLLLLTLGIVLSLPVVQTAIGDYVTETLNKDYKTDIKVEQVAISIFGGVKLKNVMIRDHHKDTLIYANRIKTNILSFKKLYNGDLMFGDIRLDGLVFNLKNYKNETDTNLDRFILLFETGKKSTKKFLLKAQNAYFTNGKFMLTDENRSTSKELYITKIDASLNNFKIYGPEVTTKINSMSFRDHRGLFVKDLKAKFIYTKQNIRLDDLAIQTKYSAIKGKVGLYYDRKDFKDFNNKVVFKIDINASTIATNDIRYFYNELGRNKVFNLQSKISGTLNNLVLKNFKIDDNKKTFVAGELNFKNLFDTKTKPFYMKGHFDRLDSNYDDVVSILPNILGKKLPVVLKKLGQYNLTGTSEVTTTYLKSDFFLTSAIGNVLSTLQIDNINNINNASYFGNVVLENFNIGNFLDRSDVGIVSLDLNVNGKGFTSKNLNTKIDGKIFKLGYNKYNYTNIIVNGGLKSPYYNGKLIVNDPNLFMDFDGILDLSKKDTRYDFHANIDFANLNKLNFTKDSIAIFKGEIRSDVSGNSLDNLSGTVTVADASYQNQQDTYIFDDFSITSKFDADKVRTIAINSPNIVEGQVVGKFQFNQLGKMIQNSIGSLYTNYKPNKVNKGQYLKFNFSVYNKIIEIFYPGIEIATNTFIKGSINSDNDEFKLNFSSPNIKAYENNFDNIRISVDNKNPLYNAFIELDSIRTKYYKVSDFSLINVTMKDTLFVRSEFKGGKKGDDFYKLNFFHTIDKDNNNVVGIKKSELKFKDYLWFLNENSTNDNKVVFDKKLKNFSIDNIIMSHENQKIELLGTVKDSTYKDLNLNFDNVDLGKIIPSIDSLKIAGNLNGKVNFKQNNNIYQPTSSLKIDNLNVNNIVLGDLNLDVEGDNSFRKFTVNSSLENENVESFLAEGSFRIENKQTYMDMDLRFNEFNLAALSPLGGNVISNIRGYVSGTSYVSGTVDKPDINGRLFLEEAGFKIPYLNTDYSFRENSIVDLSESQFLFQNATLIDTKYKTEGKLNGAIRHKNFSKWDLDLNLNADNLLVLDTGDSEDAAYYGTAFIDGNATISGPTNGLVIDVHAKSNKGTNIKIPINNSESVGSKNFMHFLTPKEKFNLQRGIISQTKDYKGLELNFDLDITRDAVIEVILDRETGHGMTARGSGNLFLEINTLGKFQMTGDYQVYEGSYNFKYRGLIDKKFEVKRYSSIVWEGDPMRARLNLEAIYKTKANPSILLENNAANRKVDVEVGINITGNLSSPEPDFTINFPNLSSVLKSEIQTKLDDKDIRQTQALTLLGTGGFASNEGVNQSALTRNLYETAGGIFDDIFQNPDDKVKVGLDIVTADKTPGYESDGSIGVTVSTQINERISVNGKVGVPVGGINESAIVGDVEVQYRVNEDGTMNLRFFNRENDINYLGEGIGYTQGLGITYQVDFDTFKALVNKIFNKKKLDLEKKSTDQVPDSDVIVPEGMNFQKIKKKKTEQPKPKDAVPPKED